MTSKEKSNSYTYVKPYNETEGKTEQLSRMFNTISHEYDKFNDIMSWGLARWWRKVALKSLQPYNPKYILDIATGTGDICIKSFQYLNPIKVTGIDISDKMMEVGRKKVENVKLTGKIDFKEMDSANLTFPSSSFDAVTISFGIRNFEQLDNSIQEIYRVLKPGGQLLILEMNEPKNNLIFKAYKLYTKYFVGLTTGFLSSDKRAYKYLTNSMRVFASGKELIEIIESHEFKIKKYRSFTFGVSSMYLFTKS